MKRIIIFTFFLIFIHTGYLTSADILSQADSLFINGGLINYEQAIDLYKTALKDNPGSYEINWKLARIHRWYAETAHRTGYKNWRDISEKYGRQGMIYGEKAIQLNPQGIEGYSYYGLCVASYTDGVSVITALAHGLKNKLQNSFERSYAMDKNFDMGRIHVALARYWHLVPWPFTDKEASEKLYREYLENHFNDKSNEKNHYLPDEAKLGFAELLIDKGGEKNIEEARQLLNIVIKSGSIYFRDWGIRVLNEL